MRLLALSILVCMAMPALVGQEKPVDPTKWTEITLPTDGELRGEFFLQVARPGFGASDADKKKFKDSYKKLPRGKVTRDSSDTRLLGFRSNWTRDADLAHLRGLTALQVLVLDHILDRTRISDAGLVHLKDLTALQRLVLSNTKVSGAGLVHLKDLTALQTLDLTRTTVTDAGLAHLKGLTALGSVLIQKKRP